MMRAKLNITEGIFPMPVLMVATYNEDGSVNVMNAAWGTMQERDSVVLNLTETHKTVQNIKARGAFTVSIADVKNVTASDYVGIASGNDTPDKMQKAGWHAEKSEVVNAPLFKELPLALECRLISYDEESCRLVGEIVNVCAEESILGEDGKIDLAKFRPITFDPVHNTYREIGGIVGKAFSDGLKLK